MLGVPRTQILRSGSEALKIKALKAIFLKVISYVRELLAMMFGCKFFYWNTVTDFSPPAEPEPFSLPAPIPKWPEGTSFSFFLFFFFFFCQILCKIYDKEIC